LPDVSRPSIHCVISLREHYAISEPPPHEHPRADSRLIEASNSLIPQLVAEGGHGDALNRVNSVARVGYAVRRPLPGYVEPAGLQVIDTHKGKRREQKGREE
jgi:hypothetical protein